MIIIWDEVFCKLRMSFDGLVTRKEVFLESSHSINTHLDMVVEVLDIKRSVYFNFCIDEQFIEFW